MKNKFFGEMGRVVPIAMLAALASCHKPDVPHQALRNFEQVNLVANKEKYHPKTIDPTLINGFGMDWSPTGLAWVNSVGGHVSEIYNADGSIGRPAVKIPSPADTINGLPTGVVFSGGKGFQIPGGTATFLFSGFDGVISGWNPAANLTAKRLKNPNGAGYTGIAISRHSAQNFLYAANFAANKIDVWDTTLSKVNMSFSDPSIPQGFSPYNIQSVGEVLFVLYAERGSSGLPVAGKGKGYVNIFSADGRLIHRLASEGPLNIPWGIAMAPAGFLQSDDLGERDANAKYEGGQPDVFNGQVLLIGNFGDGRINVYSTEGAFLGPLSSKNKPIVIDGLWALSFPPSTASIDPKRLYFTAGPEKETDGLFGYVIKR
ncbi:MAG: TIGR03118 family protein [Chitinophagaceae bacterium]|nr:TIGR03118 family protein [Chitinophagaceae bacterium]